eukprot:s3762_g6.t2
MDAWRAVLAMKLPWSRTYVSTRTPIADPIATQIQLLTKDEGRRTDRLAKERVRQMYFGSCMLRFGKVWRHCRRLPAWQRFLLWCVAWLAFLQLADSGRSNGPSSWAMIGVTGSTKAGASEPRGPSMLVEAKPRTPSEEPNTNWPFGEDKDSPSKQAVLRDPGRNYVLSQDGRIRGADSTGEEEEDDDDDEDGDEDEDEDEDDADDEDDGDDEDEEGDDDMEEKLTKQDLPSCRGKAEDNSWKATSSDETLQAGSCSQPTNSSTDVCCRGAVARIQTTAKLRISFLQSPRSPTNLQSWWSQLAPSTARFSLGAKLLESLRGDAYIVAQDLGHTVLKKESAIEEIIEAVKKQIFPLQAQEAKELYRVGSSVGGVLSRQPGESMTSYTGRRKRWYRKLKELDNSLEISDTIRADLLLDNCGLDRKERLMILTAVGDKPSFEAIEKALITQHGKLHFLESKPAPKAPGFVPRGNPYKGKGKGKKGSFQPIAYLTDPQDLFENYGEDDSVWDPENEEELVQAVDNVTAFLAGSLEDATAENIELDVMEAFISYPPHAFMAVDGGDKEEKKEVKEQQVTVEHQNSSASRELMS